MMLILMCKVGVVLLALVSLLIFIFNLLIYFHIAKSSICMMSCGAPQFFLYTIFVNSKLTLLDVRCRLHTFL